MQFHSLVIIKGEIQTEIVGAKYTLQKALLHPAWIAVY